MLVVVPGTWWRSKPAWAATYHLDSQPMQRAAAAFGVSQLRLFEWSGENSSRARGEASAKLAEELSSISGAGVHLLGFSHGGNVALSAVATLVRATQIQSLVTIATPVLRGYHPPAAMIRHIHLYSDRDLLQRGGGDWLHLPRWGTIGLAKRRYPDGVGVQNIRIEGLPTTSVTGRHGDILWWEETWHRLKQALRLPAGNIPE